MKDDEAYLLGASQRAGEFVGLDGISDDRIAMIERKWIGLGWLEPGTGRMTRKGMATKGGKTPVVEPVAAEVIVEPIPTADPADVTIEEIPPASNGEVEIVPL